MSTITSPTTNNGVIYVGGPDVSPNRHVLVLYPGEHFQGKFKEIHYCKTIGSDQVFVLPFGVTSVSVDFTNAEIDQRVQELASDIDDSPEQIINAIITVLMEKCDNDKQEAKKRFIVLCHSVKDAGWTDAISQELTDLGK